MEDLNRSINAIELFQRWMSSKNPIDIGTSFRIDDTDRVITLVECDGYPKGKFIYENGDDFDIIKNSNHKFTQVIKERKSYYNEKAWDELEKALNGDDFKVSDKNTLYYRTLGGKEEKKDDENLAFYNVTDIINEMMKNDDGDTYSFAGNIEDFNSFSYAIWNSNDPLMTRDKIKLIFRYATIEKFLGKYAMKVVLNGKDYGMVLYKDNEYYYVPNNYALSNEYAYIDDQALGFFYTADSYLDVALNTMKDYKKKFVERLEFNREVNETSYGYQASSTIKSILAFACECYIKSMLINNGVNMVRLMELGHSLYKLFMELDENIASRIIDLMKRNDYTVNDKEYHDIDKGLDIIDRFMLDLGENDNAFEDARYSAEYKKNTNYDFLYKLALSLRLFASKEYMLYSPFSKSIEENIAKKH